MPDDGALNATVENTLIAYARVATKAHDLTAQCNAPGPTDPGRLLLNVLGMVRRVRLRPDAHR